MPPLPSHPFSVWLWIAYGCPAPRWETQLLILREAPKVSSSCWERLAPLSLLFRGKSLLNASVLLPLFMPSVSLCLPVLVISRGGH